jgi:hypothetical protein
MNPFSHSPQAACDRSPLQRTLTALMVILATPAAVAFAQPVSPQFKQLAGPPSEFSAMAPADPVASATRSKSAIRRVKLEPQGQGLWGWEADLPVENDQIRIAVVSGIARSSPESWRVAVREPKSGRRRSSDDPGVERRAATLGMPGNDVPADYFSFTGIARGKQTLSIESTSAGQGFVLIEGAGPARLLSHQRAFNQRVGQRITLLAGVYEQDRNAGIPSSASVSEAILEVTTPDGSVITSVMHDDGAHQDGEARDGLYGGDFLASTAGDFVAQVVVRGRDSAGTEFLRTTEHLIPVLEERISLDGQSASGKLVSEHRLRIDLGVITASVSGRYRMFAEVWGTGTSPGHGLVPVAWIGGMTELNGGKLSLGLDTRWIAMAGAQPPFELRNVRIEDPDYFITLASSDRMPWSAPTLPEADPRADQTVPDEEMIMGPRPAEPEGKTGVAVEAQQDYSGGSGHKLLLVHGYCSSDVWGPVSGQFANAAVFLDLNKNRTHSAFADLLLDFGRAWHSYAIVAHSQGGAAALYLYAHHWSGLDNAGPGRLIQSVGTPYQDPAGRRRGRAGSTLWVRLWQELRPDAGRRGAIPRRHPTVGERQGQLLHDVVH